MALERHSSRTAFTLPRPTVCGEERGEVTMIQSRIRSNLERLKEVPFFPIVPILPAALIVGSLVLNIFLYREVRKLTFLLQSEA